MDAVRQLHGSLGEALKNHDMQGFASAAQENPGASLMEHFSPHVGFNLNPEDAQAVRHTLQDNLPKYGSTVSQILQIEKTLRTNFQMADMITKLETTQPMVPGVVRSLSAQFGQNMPLHPDGKITPRDKQQLLDQLYSGMQNAAEKGLALMDKAGFK
jgi:hypothetical protein